MTSDFRSGIEKRIAQQIESAGLPVLYETEKIHYEVPIRHTYYVPDFKIAKSSGHIFIEVKGIWTTSDRAKHLLIKEQWPQLDIRFVFSNPSNKIYKGSPTRYSDFCDKHGFLWAKSEIPSCWLTE